MQCICFVDYSDDSVLPNQMIFVPPLDAYKNTSSGRIRYLIDQITELSPISAEQVTLCDNYKLTADRTFNPQNRISRKPTTTNYRPPRFGGPSQR